jgi:two-component system response regulator AtoC
VVLGRDPASGIVVDDASVSREHACVYVKDGVVTIEDLGSRNGTRVRGQPLRRGERVTLAVNEIFELGAVNIAVKGLPGQGTTTGPSATIIPNVAAPTGAMARVYELADLVAPSPVCVLLLGETGVGKTAAAERVHKGSGRSGPLVKLNCAAVPEALLEGELFGYEKGAFTGAQTAKPGLIEAATTGTLLLDEIGDMPLATQAKLLHVVEQGEVMRLGALKPRPIDVRFIAATHRDLAQMVSANTFRADLFYRINGITITIPSLRERHDEIVSFAEHFLAATCARMSRTTPQLSPEAKQALIDYPWPGNLRELKNVMDRVALLVRSTVVPAELLGLPGGPPVPGASRSVPPGAAGATPSTTVTIPPNKDSGADLRAELDSFEREKILRALDEAGGNQTRAAEILGLPLRTFVKRLTRHGLTKPRRRPGT